MADLQVKTESLPTRCEICHQTDCFDASANYCSRCAGVSVVAPSRYSNSPAYLDAVNDSRFVKTFGFISLIGSLLNFILSFSGVGIGFGLGILGYGKTKYYRALGIAIIFITFAFGPITSLIVLSIGICFKGFSVLRVLRVEGKGDPDWLETRKRITTGMIASGVGIFVGIARIMILVLSLIFSSLTPALRTQLETRITNNYLDDGTNKTELIRAAINGDIATTKRLLAQGVKIDQRDNAGETALMYASETGHTEIVSLLHKHGADVNVKNINGLTPLMYATLNNHPETVKLLLSFGADLNMRNNVGKTAINYAKERGFDNIQIMLVSAQLATEGQN